MLVGAGILWIGWNGFNGGDPYAASPDAGAAVLNTNLCTAVSSLVWVLMDLAYYRRPSVIGAIQGMITGLVAITPAAGVVAGWGAVILGVGSGTIPWVNFASRSLVTKCLLKSGLPQSRKAISLDFPEC
jgi:Amt family ammonium transporter